MAQLLERLPTILVLAVLVGIFVSLRKHSPSARMRLWILAWALIFAHFFVQLFEVEGRTGLLEGICDSIDLAALELSGIVFLVSLSRSAEHRRRRLALLTLLGAPTVFHAVAVTLDWRIPWVLAGALALAFFGGLAFPALVHRRFSPFHACIGVLLVAAGIWAVHAQLRGNPNPAVISILMLSFGLSGVFFWRRYPRLTPGVITAVGGFLAWGAVFPVGILMDHFYPNLKVNADIWNVPKFFVAFGLILTLIEDKSRIIEESSAREHAENAMLQRFSRITSRLLRGRDPTALWGEIAEAVTATSNFRSAAILLAQGDGSLGLTGSSGVSSAEVEALEKRSRERTVAWIQQLCGAGSPVGNNSFCFCRPEILNPAGRAGEEVIVPVVSSRGSPFGWIVLWAPGEVCGTNTPETVKVEMLATDLAVTIENKHLHHQLVRSEKLAALGQLVAGVAHELNNPLTCIIGYSDLLSEEVRQEGAAARISKLGREARRMKRIVDGLLRFARRNNPEGRAADFEAAMRDALLLREYHLRSRGVQIHAAIEPLLPEVAISEDELKQVMLNLLNNAVDAVEDAPDKSIRIQAARRDGHVEIRVEDDGPGFPDPNRAFDPFYTTKPVGKGTGLGLSICYGIVRECGGQIHLANRQPRGASVVVELPVAHRPAVPVPA